MVTFMLGVLSSVIFWVGFFFIGLFIGTVVLKFVAPRSYRYITTKQTTGYDDKAEYVFITILIFSLWPFVLVGLIFGAVMKFILWGAFSKLVVSVSKIIPKINFEKE